MSVYTSDHITNLTSPHLILTDLVSSQPVGCEATQFAVVATNQNRLILDGDLSHACLEGRH